MVSTGKLFISTLWFEKKHIIYSGQGMLQNYEELPEKKNRSLRSTVKHFYVRFLTQIIFIKFNF